MNTKSLNARSRIPALALLGLLALAVAALVFSPAPPVQGQDSATVAFSPSSIPNKTYTQGAYVPKGDPSATVSTPRPPFTPYNTRWTALRLPEATVTSPTGVNWDVTYSITGLPDGLSMDPIDRIIRGTPTTVTSSPASVTYTATVQTYTVAVNNGRATRTDGVSGSASINFTISVVAPPAFDAQARRFFSKKIVAWISGRGWTDGENERLSQITLPGASGGHGTLTHYLFDNQTGQALYAVRERYILNNSSEAGIGITYVRADRVLGGTPAGWARRTWPVSYYAEDENGSRAAGHFTIYAGGLPGGL